MPNKKQLFIGGSSAAALLAFGAVFTLIVSGSGSQTQDKLGVALSLLDEGRWDVAGRIARDVAKSKNFESEKDATWQYIQGVSKLKSVEENLDTPQHRRVLLDAAQHLAKSELIGFSPGYMGKGKFYSGWCSFNTYDWDKATEQLSDVERLWPEKRSDVLRMVVESQLRKTPPDLPAAESTLEKWMAIPGMSDTEQARIKISQAALAFLKRDTKVCEDLLSSIPATSSEYFNAQLLRARWRLEFSGDKAELAEHRRSQLLSEAGDISRELKVAAATPAHLRRQATYLCGRILRQQSATREALSTFSGARQSSPHSAEAIASGLEESEILASAGNLDEAIANLQQLLSNIEDLALYNEMWIPLSEFRARLLEIGRKMKNQGDFVRAIELAQLLALAFPLSDSVRLQAEALEQWADNLKQSTLGPTARMQQEARDELQTKYRQAAEHFERLAALELRSAEYPDIVWQAITNFQEAGELNRANALLTDYLRYEDRTKRPRGFLALGRNHINAARWQDAIDPLERCQVEHPAHPLSFEARLLAAKALFELNRLDDAVALLDENLTGNTVALDPRSEIWRDSLYQLGQTIFRQGNELQLELRLKPEADLAVKEAKLEASHRDFLEVVKQLGGFVTRYPDDPRHYEAMYLVAKSHRLAAATPLQIANSNPNIVDTARRKLMQDRRGLLEQALDEFKQLHVTINGRQTSLATSDQINALIRNCYFGEADTLFELGRWEEAIQAYQNVASRFLNKPESLEALLQMAQCYRKLRKESTAKKILAQAEQVLGLIPPEYDTQFVSLTRTTRQGWGQLIGSLRSWD